DLRGALLVLADGTTFEGEAVGAEPPGGVAAGEVVFNTVLSGYQEVLTDPSYAGQVIAFTYPHIGNYGVAEADDESRRPFCRGVVVRDLARRPSSWRAADDLGSWLARHGVPGIAGVDTRRLTRHIREAGSMPCAFGTSDERTLKEAALAEPGTDGVDLVATVTTTDPYTVTGGALRVVAYDFGIKSSILRLLREAAASGTGRGWPPSGRCRPRRRLRAAASAAPTAPFSRTDPATPRPSPTPATPSRPCSVGGEAGTTSMVATSRRRRRMLDLMPK